MRHGFLMAAAVAGLALGSAGALSGSEIGALPSTDAGGDADAAGEIEYTVCGQGVLRECGSITSQRCTQFVPSSGGGTIGIAPGGGSISGNLSGTCISVTTTVTKLYKDRYKPKST